MWEQSAELNRARGTDYPISAATISGVGKRGNTSCQHALIMLRWLGRPPEDFIAEPDPNTVGVLLPATDSAHRLRWDLEIRHGYAPGSAHLPGARQAGGGVRLRRRVVRGLRPAGLLTVPTRLPVRPALGADVSC